MKLAVTGTIYDIEPVSGIDEVIRYFTDMFKFKKPKCIACTYSFNPLVLERLANICGVLRVFAGKGYDGMIRGAYVSRAQIHFKTIYMWDSDKTVVYVGSSNLSEETGGNYGLIFVKQDSLEFFDTNVNTKNYREWHDPLDVIINEIVTRETSSRCEMCDNITDRLYLDENGKLVCEKCYSR